MKFRRFTHGVVDSTNERAFARIATGTACHGDVHVALGQTQGRGRRGRSWVSEPGQGLYLSLILLPRRPLPPAALTVAAGLALIDTARDLGLTHARLKWPNDLTVDGAKLAGILVETRGLQLERPHYVVGIGLNVLQQDFPTELLSERPVTSLAGLGCDTRPDQVETRLLEALDERLGQVLSKPQELERDYAAAARLDVGRLRVQTAESEHRGTLVRFGFEDGLTLRTEEGERVLPLEHVRQVFVEG